MSQKQYAVRPNKLKGMSNLLRGRYRCAATKKAIRRWWLQSNTPLIIAKQYTAGLENNTSEQSISGCKQYAAGCWIDARCYSG